MLALQIDFGKRLTRAAAALLLCAAPLLADAQTVTYFHNDAAGTPLLATDAAGAVVWKESYQPYGGKLNNQPAALGNQIGFAGKPYDNASGLAYAGARYYDPVLGRFMGVDPAAVEPGSVHGFNRYAYANNNPYKYVDPDGASPITVVQMLRVDASIQLYQQCKAASCVSSTMAGMVQVRDSLRADGVDPIDRSAINANIGQAAVRLGDMEPALGAIAGAGIVSLTQGGGATQAAAKIAGGHAFDKHVLQLGECFKRS